MSKFSKVNVSNDARTELHDQLSLTGAEISINNLSAGTGVPFVHSHKQNEEFYGVLSGKGKAVIRSIWICTISRMPYIIITCSRQISASATSWAS